MRERKRERGVGGVLCERERNRKGEGEGEGEGGGGYRVFRVSCWRARVYLWLRVCAWLRVCEC